MYAQRALESTGALLLNRKSVNLMTFWARSRRWFYLLFTPPKE
nr:MAG TPA: hypothetical protein [Bacteriophage sp.]